VPGVSEGAVGWEQDGPRGDVAAIVERIRGTGLNGSPLGLRINMEAEIPAPTAIDGDVVSAVRHHRTAAN